uniref:glutaminyl-peptide cyclotransferase n=1 Tax=Candidatus Electrothrix sp. TaxID=2170559 RepID=UPI0040560EBA
MNLYFLPQIGLILLTFWGSTVSVGAQIPQPSQYTYSMVQQYPHDPKAFTQGLAWNA